MNLRRRSAVSSWTPRHVLEAAAASQWCPDGAVEVLTDDYRLIRYPDWALDPAFPAAQVTRSRSERAAAEVIGEVAERVRQWGKPAAVGGCTLRGEVAHLWGAVTLREYRRRGAYRAVLAERLRLARAHGATLALVKGRVETSGPILLRSGFAAYSEERCYWLPVV